MQSNEQEVTSATSCEPTASEIPSVVATPAEEGDDDADLEVVYVNPTQAFREQASARGGKGGIRDIWTEPRLLSLLQTAVSLAYAGFRFNAVNLSHGLKGRTMKQIRAALQTDPILWHVVPVHETLDLWLDNAVAAYLQKRGKRGNKDNTGEGDDPDIGARVTIYNDPELDAELACYVRQGSEKYVELEMEDLNRRDEEEVCDTMMRAAMNNAIVKAPRKRGSSSATSSRQRARHGIGVDDEDDSEDGAAVALTRQQADAELMRTVRVSSKAIADKAKADVMSANANEMNAQANLMNAKSNKDMNGQLMQLLNLQMEVLASMNRK